MKCALNKKVIYENRIIEFLHSKYLFKIFPFLLIIFVVYLLFFNITNLLTSQFHTSNPTPTKSPEELENEKLEIYVQKTLSSMRLEEKIGQMVMWGINEASLSAETTSMIKDTHAGGVIIMIKKDQEFTPQQINKLTHQIKNLNSNIPLFIAIDGEIGLIKNKITGYEYDSLLPKYMDENKFCSEITDISNFLYDNGINVNLGIIADINWNLGYNIIRDRTYGTTPESVKKRVAIAIDCSNENILTTVKHFPGHGRTTVDSHYSSPLIDVEYNEWLNTDKIPFQESIDKKVDFVMMGNLIYTKIASEPAVLSLTQNSIVRRMGFDGIIITDDLGMLERRGRDPEKIITKAINANNDILLFVTLSLKPHEIVSHIMSEVEKKNISINRIDDSVKRILRAKYSLFDYFKRF